MFAIKIVKDGKGSTELLSSERMKYWKETPNIKITNSTGEYKVKGERLKLVLYGKDKPLTESYEIKNATVYIMQNGKTVETLRVREVEECITEKVEE